MAGKSHTHLMAAPFVEVDGSSAKWPWEKAIWPRHDHAATSARTNERTIRVPDSFASRSRRVDSGRIVRSVVTRGVCLRGSPRSVTAPQTVSRERSLVALDRFRDNRRGRRNRLRPLTRTCGLDERSGVEVLARLARSVPRANGANFDTVRIENPRNVFHVSGERRAEERTNELTSPLTTGFARKGLGQIVRGDGLARTCHERIIAHSAVRVKTHRTFVRSLPTMTTNVRVYNTDNVVSPVNVRALSARTTPPYIPRRDNRKNFVKIRLDRVGFLARRSSYVIRARHHVVTVADEERTFIWAALYRKSPERAYQACDEIVKRRDVPQALMDALGRFELPTPRGDQAVRTAPITRHEEHEPTLRELEVLWYYAHGLRYRAVADELGITVHTVKSLTQSAYQKLGARNCAHAVAIAIRRGLLFADEERSAA